LNYDDLTFNKQAQEGHLPVLLWGFWGFFGVGGLVFVWCVCVSSLASRSVSCNL